ncbi:hypothetical protein M885DRAFT_610003 [Pelagophyceae sp. CCMP2097]|nr:hypothetical protein M885DRAFT_610003 [Pelagophyceae sp. CCMP2097]
MSSGGPSPAEAGAQLAPHSVKGDGAVCLFPPGSSGAYDDDDDASPSGDAGDASWDAWEAGMLRRVAASVERGGDGGPASETRLDVNAHDAPGDVANPLTMLRMLLDPDDDDDGPRLRSVSRHVALAARVAHGVIVVCVVLLPFLLMSKRAAWFGVPGSLQYDAKDRVNIWRPPTESPAYAASLAASLAIVLAAVVFAGAPKKRDATHQR